MLPPESAPSAGDSDQAERAFHNLREQVSQLESALAARDAVLEQCRQRQALFETAALERLRVIEEGDKLLLSRADEILALQLDAAQLRLQVGSLARELASSAGSHAEERQRLHRACREASRGMAELASRERALTRELLELRNAGLLHSIIRRLRSFFS